MEKVLGNIESKVSETYNNILQFSEFYSGISFYKLNINFKKRVFLTNFAKLYNQGKGGWANFNFLAEVNRGDMQKEKEAVI